MSQTGVPRRRSRILVGADGSTGALDAVVWAAREAQLHDAHLDVVHVVRAVPLRRVPETIGAPLPMASSPDVPAAAAPAPADGRWEAAQLMLSELVSEVGLRVPGVRVSAAVIEADDVADALVGEAAPGREFRMVVTGRRGMGHWAEGLLGSTSRAVATVARVPVVVHPGVSTGADDLDAEAPVVVAVGPEDTAAMGFAMVEATKRGVDVIAVHAMGDGPGERLERVHAGLRLIDDVAALWRDGFPEDLVHPKVVPGPVVPAVLAAAASTGAGLLVVGRGRGAGGRSASLGGIPGLVLEHAELPVVIVP